MKQFPGIILLIALGAGLWLTACNGSGDKKENSTGSVLRQPPYAPLTDSIKQAGTPGNAGLFYRRGELLSRNNMHELAADDYKQAWALSPDEATGLHLASTLTILGKTNDAVTLLRDCIQKFPSNTSFPGLLGDTYLQSGQNKAALDLYNNLLEKDSLNFEAWYEKGLILEKTRDTTGAIEALKKAYGLQQVNTYALELAHLYAETGNSKALQLCEEVMKKDSGKELLDPLFIKGIYYSNTGQYKTAIVQFDSCVGRDWKFTDAWLEKGIAQFHLKNYDEAMKTFQMTIQVSNSYPDGYYWVGRCYEVMGSTNEAILYYQRALGLDKDFREAADGIRRLKG